LSISGQIEHLTFDLGEHIDIIVIDSLLNDSTIFYLSKCETKRARDVFDKIFVSIFC